MNILQKTLKAVGLDQNTLCRCGCHKMVWYSKADFEMYYTEGRNCGPLVECACCNKILHIEEVNLEDVAKTWLSDSVRNAKSPTT